MNRLKLDDPLWKQLDTCNGKAGWVPAVLAHLLEHPVTPIKARREKRHRSLPAHQLAP